MSILREELITNHLLLDYFDLWDEFDIKSANDTQEVRYYNLLMNLINGQIDAGIRWLNSDDAKEYFTGETEYQREVFQALEDEWDTLLEGKYNSVDALLSEVYRRGKAKGYSDMRDRIRYTDADKLALSFAREYNFGLIQIYDDDVRNQIKNKITEGVLAGDHPNTIAPKILSIAEERLKGSNFTPKQRATMIARTEVSRVQNTGILQSYVNEGYTEVKILTAEDDNVCDLCLRYAFEFNNSEDITFENRGVERVHNIIKLLNGGIFPPFHPICRCTYLSVWESKGNSKDNSQVVKLVSRKAFNKVKDKVNKIINRKENNLKTPKETAEYFGLKYKGLESYGGRDYHKFYDKDYDCSFYIDNELTQGVDVLVSLTNDGSCLHNLKDILKTYHEALPLMKKTTKSISFCNYDDSEKNLGLNTRYFDPNHKYYGQNFIEIYKSSVTAPLESSSNAHMSLLHELSHSIDLNSIEGLNISKNPLYPIAVLKDKISRCSVFAENDPGFVEDVAEAIAMIAFKNRSDKKFAVITVNVPEYDEYGNIIKTSTETIGYEEFCELFKNRVSLIENLLGL